LLRGLHRSWRCRRKLCAADRELADADADYAAAADRAALLTETRFRAGLTNLLLVLGACRMA
jgi:hypothetical protein